MVSFNHVAKLTYFSENKRNKEFLELFLNHSAPITKNKILEEVWKYASDADTHTVETHVYRLRKKINNTFKDENFIISHDKGYKI